MVGNWENIMIETLMTTGIFMLGAVMGFFFVGWLFERQK